MTHERQGEGQWANLDCYPLNTGPVFVDVVLEDPLGDVAA